MAFENPLGQKARKRVPGEQLPQDVQTPGGQQEYRDDLPAPVPAQGSTGPGAPPTPEVPTPAPPPNEAPPPPPPPPPMEPVPAPGEGPTQPNQPRPVPPEGPINFIGGSNDFDESTGTYRSTGTQFPPNDPNRRGYVDPTRSPLEQRLIDQLTKGDAEKQKFNESVRQRVLDMLNTKDAPTAQDADFKQQTSAFNSANRKATDKRRAQMAEFRASQGQLDSGAFEADVERGLRDAGTAEAQFAGGLVGERQRQRLAELQTALALGGQFMSQDEQQQLQKEMALLDNELRKNQFAGDLDFRKKMGGGQMNLGLLEMLMRNQQFGDQLGFNIGAFGHNAARDSILDLL